MAVQAITYDNKVALNVNPDIADVNKVTDNDMNEIKGVVNNNSSELSTVFSNMQVVTATKSVGTINANSDLFDQTFNVSSFIPSGYSALGLVGVGLSGTYYSHIALNRHYLSGTTVYYALKNTYTSAATITITFYILCVKTTL